MSRAARVPAALVLRGSKSEAKDALERCIREGWELLNEGDSTPIRDHQEDWYGATTQTLANLFPNQFPAAVFSSIRPRRWETFVASHGLALVEVRYRFLQTLLRSLDSAAGGDVFPAALQRVPSQHSALKRALTPVMLLAVIVLILAGVAFPARQVIFWPVALGALFAVGCAWLSMPTTK